MEGRHTWGKSMERGVGLLEWELGARVAADLLPENEPVLAEAVLVNRISRALPVPAPPVVSYSTEDGDDIIVEIGDYFSTADITETSPIYQCTGIGHVYDMNPNKPDYYVVYGALIWSVDGDSSPKKTDMFRPDEIQVAWKPNIVSNEAEGEGDHHNCDCDTCEEDDD